MHHQQEGWINNPLQGTWIADVMHRVQRLSYSSINRKIAGVRQLKCMQIVDFMHRTMQDQNDAALNVPWMLLWHQVQMLARAELGPGAYAFISSFQPRNVSNSIQKTSSLHSGKLHSETSGDRYSAVLHCRNVLGAQHSPQHDVRIPGS